MRRKEGERKRREEWSGGNLKWDSFLSYFSEHGSIECDCVGANQGSSLQCDSPLVHNHSLLGPV